MGGWFTDWVVFFYCVCVLFIYFLLLSSPTTSSSFFFSRLEDAQVNTFAQCYEGIIVPQHILWEAKRDFGTDL